jgi:hypothetical protein
MDDHRSNKFKKYIEYNFEYNVDHIVKYHMTTNKGHFTMAKNVVIKAKG